MRSRAASILFAAAAANLLAPDASRAGQHVFSVRGEPTLLDSRPFLVKGLRVSNALISDRAADELIGNLDKFRKYGVNTISVFLQQFTWSRTATIKNIDNVQLSPGPLTKNLAV